MQKIKLGFIGVGGMGSYLLSLAINMKDIEVVAISDIDPNRLKEVSKKYRINKAYSNYKELLEEDIDAVVIATPPKYHVEPTIQALKNNIHVLVEKPLAVDLEQAMKIYNAYKSSKSIVMVTFSLRYHKLCQDIAYFGSKLGLPQNMIHICYGKLPSTPWIVDKSISGGMINENGVHVLYVFKWLAGDISRVYAIMKTRGENRNIEDDISIILEHKNKCITTYVQNWNSNISWRKWGFIFEKGSIVVDGYIDGTMHIKANNSDLDLTISYSGGVKDMYLNELKHFISSIRNKEKPLTSIEEGVYIQRIVDAIYRSTQIGQPVKLD